jgi:hypothetical protein
VPFSRREAFGSGQAFRSNLCKEAGKGFPLQSFTQYCLKSKNLIEANKKQSASAKKTK